MRILVLGGYGFIGREVAYRLIAAGHEVVIAGRDRAAARSALPEARFVHVDLSHPDNADAWLERLQGVDVVVNAAGALQSGARDKLEAVHHLSIAALVDACEQCGVGLFVQISAAGAKLDATTEFLRSKARGDAYAAASDIPSVFLRPGLVIGPNAYGGTALIRMLASVPVIQPLGLPDAPIQTIGIDDLSAIVVDAVEGRLPAGTTVDLVEDDVHSLREVVIGFRRWLGIEEPRLFVVAPVWLLAGVARVADGLGHLGWRSPLRTTALRVLAEGVRGDPGPYARIGSRPIAPLEQTLRAMPATLQDRWFARLYLLIPAILVVLALFWILTGVIALISLDESVRLSGLGDPVGRAAVIAGAIIDICLGAAILYRPWARLASAGMGIVTVVYLSAGSIVRPDLWADPLGPLLKAVPILVLTLIVALIVEDR